MIEQLPRILQRSTVVAVLTLLPTVEAGAQKTPSLTIRLHCEGSTSDGPSFVTELKLNDGRKLSIRKVPVVNERDITAFYPLPGNDGLSGAYFRLDAHGTNKLHQLGIENQGSSAVVVVNGRPASLIKVSKNKDDGIFYVPGGLRPEEILQLEGRFPIMGRESEFGKKKRQPKPQPAS